VRVFELSSPPRIVIDFAAEPVEGFDAPPDTRPILRGAAVISQVEPEPVVEPVPAVEPAPLIEPGPIAEPTPMVGPPPTVEPMPTAEPAPVAEPAPAAGIPPIPPERTGPIPTPHAPGGPMRWLPIAGTVVVAILLGTILLMTRRRRAAVTGAVPADEPPDDEMFDPETITQAEIDAGADRVEILERRLDDEVRARVQIEDQLTSAREEQKVLRDRLRRLSRERPG